MPLVKEKRLTTDYYRLLPEGAPYQLIEGELVMTPAPNPRHQMISANLFKKISEFVDKEKRGTILYSPIDVYLGRENAYQPDIIFISKEREGIIKEDGIYGAPDLVIEILSQSTARYDLREKFKVYERYGVREYWIVDPEMKGIEVFILNKSGEFELSVKSYEGGSVISMTLYGLEINLKDIFGF